MCGGSKYLPLVEITHDDILARAQIRLDGGERFRIDVAVEALLGVFEAVVGLVDHGCGAVRGCLGGEVFVVFVVFVVVHGEGDEALELSLHLLFRRRLDQLYFFNFFYDMLDSYQFSSQ
jgi:hypothetical protein